MEMAGYGTIWILVALVRLLTMNRHCTGFLEARTLQVAFVRESSNPRRSGGILQASLHVPTSLVLKDDLRFGGWAILQELAQLGGKTVSKCFRQRSNFLVPRFGKVVLHPARRLGSIHVRARLDVFSPQLWCVDVTMENTIARFPPSTFRII